MVKLLFYMFFGHESRHMKLFLSRKLWLKMLCLLTAFHDALRVKKFTPRDTLLVTHSWLTMSGVSCKLQPKMLCLSCKVWLEMIFLSCKLCS